MPGVAAIHSNLKQIHVYQKTGNIDPFPVCYKEDLLEIHVMNYLLGPAEAPPISVDCRVCASMPGIVSDIRIRIRAWLS